MTIPICKSAAFVLVIFPILRIHHGASAECNLEKIFRTPKDMSKVNFDHFELVERTGFDRSAPPTTFPTTETPSTIKKNGPNVANAQVLVRFGGDDVYGSNHIMKIPPQCRHFGNSLNHPADLYYPPPPPRYPPPCHPHYYHPYPPPVPFTFPNYYYCNHGPEPQYLPTQLREYFMRHPDFFGEGRPSHGRQVFIRGQPMKRGRSRDYGVPADFANVRKSAVVNIENPKNVLPDPQIELVRMRPRVLEYLDPGNEEIERKIPKKRETKKNWAKENPKVVVKKAADDKNNSLPRSEKKPKNQDKNGKNDEQDTKDCLEKQLNNSLVAYKCKHCMDSPKMLVSYPITDRQEDEESASDLKPILSPSNCPYCDASSPARFANDIDGLGALNTRDINDSCKCVNCQCNKKNDNDQDGKKIAKDLDDLISIIVTDILDRGEGLREAPIDDGSLILYPDLETPVIPIAKLARIALDLADDYYKISHQIPLKATLDVNLEDFGYDTTFTQESAPEYRYESIPETVRIYEAPTKVNLPIPEPQIEYRRYSLPEPSISSRKLVIPEENPLPNFLRAVPKEPSRIIINADIPRHRLSDSSLEEYSPYRKYPSERPKYYFFPEPNVSLEKIAEKRHNPLPKYLKVIPRDDLDVVPPKFVMDREDIRPPRQPRQVASYCSKCGRNQAGGKFCTHCGSPVILCRAPYCATCPRETRQLNDW